MGLHGEEVSTLPAGGRFWPGPDVFTLLLKEVEEMDRLIVREELENRKKMNSRLPRRLILAAGRVGSAVIDACGIGFSRPPFFGRIEMNMLSRWAGLWVASKHFSTSLKETAKTQRLIR